MHRGTYDGEVGDEDGEHGQRTSKNVEETDGHEGFLCSQWRWRSQGVNRESTG